MKDLVLVNEWYPVMWARDLQAAPQSVRLLGEQVVVFRTSTGVYAFRDLCIHRGSALSLGRVENDTLVCAYHGWSYGCNGQCVRIPSNKNPHAIPAKARAETYHCAEKYGMIWVCLGEPRAALPDHPEWSDPGYRTVHCGPIQFAAQGPRVMENLIDISHLMWVHDGILGDSNLPEVPDFEVQRTAYGFQSSEVVFYQPNPFGTGQGMTGALSYDIISPLACRISKTTRETGEISAMLFCVVPESEQATSIYTLRSRNYALNEPDEDFAAFQTRITLQDKPVVESQRPELVPLNLSEELHLKSDRLAIEYRRWLRELGVTMGIA